MQRASREVWAKRVERWVDGGLTAKEYASEIGVSPRTLTYWKWKLLSEQRRAGEVAAPAPSTPAFLEITPQPKPTQERESPEPFELILGTLTLRIPQRFDADALKQLLAAVAP